MKLAPGIRLGPYEIISQLGAGGMGEVHRARDTRLGREVAIKSLPVEFAQDADRLARFEREATLLASLSHPNIAGVHGLEEAAGARYLVLEFVEGETLAARLARGPLPVEDALHVCAQVAAAVEAAHEAGIIHRDLKPGNVMLKPDGTVRVLDFGLAKSTAASRADSAQNLSASPTLTHAGTSAGVVLGTAAYMSPEQARGKPVDRRTDIWSFGCVLYECLTGKQLFGGETVSDIIARILQTAPDWSALPAATPVPVRHLLERCLDRDPKRRLRDIGEARIALEAAREHPGPTQATGPARAGIPVRTALLAGAALVLFTVAAVWTLRPSPDVRSVRVLDLSADGVETEWFLTPQLSRDGSRIAYSSGDRIRVRDLDDLEPREVADLTEPTPIMWSPDGEWIAYASRNQLLKVSVKGGAPIAVASIPGTGSIVGGVWGDDGSIVIAVWRGGLYRISASSGATSLLLAPDPATQVDFHFPTFLPDGGILYIAHWKSLQDSTGNRRALLQVLRDGRSYGVASDLLGDSGWPVYQDGKLLLRSASTSGLLMTGFDPRAALIQGDPVLVIPDIASFSLADDGSLLYMKARPDAGANELGRIDLTGAWQEVVVQAHPGLGEPALSPDGKHIAFAAGSDEDREVWIHDVLRRTDTRLTFDSGYHDLPRWLDKDRIIYAWLPAGMSMNSVVVMQNADGSGTPRRVSQESAVGTGSPIIDTTSDPREFLQIIDAQGRGELRLLGISDGEGTFEPRRVLQEEPEPNVLSMRASPDGRFLAYVVEQGGQPEVFLTRYPSGDGKWQVSTDGGRLPRWSRDGRMLYFVSGSGPAWRALVGVEVDPAAAVPLGARDTLFPLTGEAMRSLEFALGYEVDPTGNGFLVVRPAGGVTRTNQRMILVQNWRGMVGTAARSPRR